MGAAGHPDAMTPTVDALCGMGVRFTRAMAQTPSCIPARRSMMTGLNARSHGDRVFSERLEMPRDIPTLAGTFSAAGYQTTAVGKLHVYPQRDRIGFGEAFINEEGRHHLGMERDDYESYLVDAGYAGAELTHGMGVNQYHCRPWHLPEDTHPTAWTARETCRAIKRKDPTRPAFWMASFSAPHPPLTPPAAYLDEYRRRGVRAPAGGEWSRSDDLPQALRIHRHAKPGPGNDRDIELSRMGFYALCTHIDHQIRLIIGTLREEGLLDDTIILFTSDHGDMLGDHGLWAKTLFFRASAGIPMILVDHRGSERVAAGSLDDRLCGHEDIMPTLLALCGLPVPPAVEGLSLVGDRKRDRYYGEHFEDARAARMICRDDLKLIWYPCGNRFQLFDMARDPDETVDESENPEYAGRRRVLEESLVEELYGTDLEWVADGRLVGFGKEEWPFEPDRGLGAQRGWRF